MIWVDEAVVLAIHEEQIAEHGGSLGLRDSNLLQSALARPRNLMAYGQPDLADLAASYAFGLAKNHAFVDGNKRVSLVVTETFILLNNGTLIADDAACLDIWLRLAAGQIDEAQLAIWLRENLVLSGESASS
jgi:death on curing protein